LKKGDLTVVHLMVFMPTIIRLCALYSYHVSATRFLNTILNLSLLYYSTSEQKLNSLGSNIQLPSKKPKTGITVSTCLPQFRAGF
jgi:hypothetical protein